MSAKLREIMSDVVGTFSLLQLKGETRLETDKQVKRLTQRIGCELVLVRDRYAANTLITTMLFDINRYKMCLAYQYNGKLYTTRRNVPNHESTDYLHTLKMSSEQWDSLPRFDVWIDSGNVYGVVPA